MCRSETLIPEKFIKGSLISFIAYLDESNMGGKHVVIDAMTQQNIADDESEQITTETIADAVEEQGMHVIDAEDVEVEGRTHPTVTISDEKENAGDLEDGEPLMAIDYHPGADMFGLFAGVVMDNGGWDVTDQVSIYPSLEIQVMDADLILAKEQLDI